MVLPSTTLSQNIGIISLTKCASRIAGYACGVWMLLYGIFGKFGALFTSIPVPVLGGMSTFLFANITISGIKVMTSQGVNRRARFILAVSGAFGIGTIIIPEWFNNPYFLDCDNPDYSPALQGFCDAVVLTMSTGYAVGCLIAMTLNGILPSDPDDDEEVDADENEHHHVIEEAELAKLVEDPEKTGVAEQADEKGGAKMAASASSASEEEAA